MSVAFVNARILTPGGFVAGHALLIDGARITALVGAHDERLAHSTRINLAGRLLLPGFIDTQVNGGGGVLFNDSPTLDGIRAIGAGQGRSGTTAFRPTRA